MNFEENKPFIFFSYAHKNSQKAMAILKGLQDSGFNVWYDEGIEVGTEYSDFIAEHIECCRVFVCVMDEDYIASTYCRDEIDFAVNNRKEILIIYEKEIRDLNIPAGLKMRTARYQAVFLNRYGQNIRRFIEELRSALILRPCLLVKPEEPKVEKKKKKKAEEPPFAPTYEQKKQAAQLIDLFSDFDLKVESFSGVCEGPRVTGYEFIPSKDQKLSEIASLADDFSLFLGRGHVRMICPIPGKKAFGMEIPNAKGSFVDFEEVYASEELQDPDDPLSVALGKDLYSRPLCMELSKMPHLLIGGAEGSGKTSLINTMIMSIIKSNSPDEVRLILADPKGGQLSAFESLPHLLMPVIQDPRECISALFELYEKCVGRYKLFSESMVRTLDAYNEISDNKLPRIVVFIDEASLILKAARDDFETAVCNIAQRGRAAGIHIVMATGDLSSKSIPTMIKANIPSRIALKTGSETESRAVIDQKGAERLMSKGDMLYCPLGANAPIRAQASFIPLEKLSEMLPKKKAETSKKKVSGDVYRAITAAVEEGAVTTKIIRTRLEVGEAKALRLIKELEALEILAPAEKRGHPRKVLISKEDLTLFEEE
ncbi:MAG: TIR domain-containing protein [Ruminococcaceae bacterium]|nr:TIR domain-containing protein [Oscillospiraceae bacterium]